MSVLGPRLVVAGTASGVGKTTVATGLMAALRRAGHTVAAAKVGPDFIDPGYHRLATGRPARNLDAWLCGPEAVPALAGRAAAGADLLVVEGVMGMFDGAAVARSSADGASGGGPVADTASVARDLSAPVVLVVDASAMSGSVAALVHGFATWDPGVGVDGVVLNRVGSPGHAELLREALAPLGVPVLGALPRDDRLTWRDRHLGLVPVAEDPDGIGRRLDALADVVAGAVDLEAVVALGRRAPAVAVGEPPLPAPVGGRRPVVAVAGGPAFSFVYQDNLEAMEAAGADLVGWDPTADRRVPPEASAVYLGGGFPEVFAAQLADNQPLLADARRRIGAGLVTWAECGGLLWLARSLDGHRLAGVVPADGAMTGRLTLGYRRARTRVASPLGPPGTELAGHEFHYSQLTPPGDAVDLTGRFGAGPGGWATPTLLASYLHVHCGGDPSPARAFVAAAALRASNVA